MQLRQQADDPVQGGDVAGGQHQACCRQQQMEWIAADQAVQHAMQEQGKQQPHQNALYGLLHGVLCRGGGNILQYDAGRQRVVVSQAQQQGVAGGAAAIERECVAVKGQRAAAEGLAGAGAVELARLVLGQAVDFNQPDSGVIDGQQLVLDRVEGKFDPQGAVVAGQAQRAFRRRNKAVRVAIGENVLQRQIATGVDEGTVGRRAAFNRINPTGEREGDAEQQGEQQ